MEGGSEAERVPLPNAFGGKRRIRTLPIEYVQSHSAPPLLLRRKRRTLRKSPPKRTRTAKPKGVKWVNKEGKAPLQHIQYYFPKQHTQVGKKYMESLNANQLEALYEQQPISELPYPAQTLRAFNREVLPTLQEDETLTKKNIEEIRKDYMVRYTEERTEEIMRAPLLLTKLTDWVLIGKLLINKKSKEYKLTKKQIVELQSDDFSMEEIELALDLLNQSVVAAEKRAKAAALFSIAQDNESLSNISDPEFKKMMKRLHGIRKDH